MITKEDAFDIGRQKYPGADKLGFAAIYAEGYYDAVVACEEADLEAAEKGAGWGEL